MPKPTKKPGYFRSLYNRTKYRGGIVLNNPVAMAGVRALKMAKNLRSLVNTEQKDIVHNGTINPTNAGDVRAIGGININEGDTSSTRDGRSIKAKSWYMRCSLSSNSLATNTTVRMLLVHDRQVNGALPAAGDILESVSIVGLMNRDNGDRFKVLFDKVFVFNDFVTGGFIEKYVTKYKKLNMHIKYSGTGGGIADLKSNELILLTISNQASNLPSVTYRARLKYVDN